MVVLPESVLAEVITGKFCRSLVPRVSVAKVVTADEAEDLYLPRAQASRVGGLRGFLTFFGRLRFFQGVLDGFFRGQALRVPGLPPGVAKELVAKKLIDTSQKGPPSSANSAS